MDQIIAALMVLLVGIAGMLAAIEPLSAIIKAIFNYLKLIFLGPIKLEETHDQERT